METVSIPLDGDPEKELRMLLSRVGPNGYFEKHRVDRIEGKLVVEVRANEHPPPHFHVVYNGEDASFSIVTGERLANVRGLERYEHTILVWWKHNKRKIALKWNECRPTNCSVGPVPVPD
ncbi:DUF4160 domain-containing protein [Agrobacterium rhizogenes]|uniref:DUF4160 domain-containing protein n=1 Tax=Rhizobium rhizogenes TaxID=359 RepID=UPI001573B404|nr:DUF4160 domain-containing protein [Rhizobium rhizogenes]NTG48590.1 DUF4160 domain-containing protein [Rhizobium rhizogenes]